MILYGKRILGEGYGSMGRERLYIWDTGGFDREAILILILNGQQRISHSVAVEREVDFHLEIHVHFTTLSNSSPYTLV